MKFYFILLIILATIMIPLAYNLKKVNWKFYLGYLILLLGPMAIYLCTETFREMNFGGLFLILIMIPFVIWDTIFIKRWPIQKYGKK